MQEYAAGIFDQIPTRSAVKKALKREEILIDGRVALTSDWVQEGQKIELFEKEAAPEKLFRLKLEVLFEDEDMAVINKPAGYPTSGNYFRTIGNALPFNLKPSEKPDALIRPSPVHRLDNPTSGLLITAKTVSARQSLHRQFEDRLIKKTYQAIVHGEIPENAFYEDPIEGKPAFTAVRRLSSFIFRNQNFSYIEANPETGRTHQIRIHLSENGFPIVGDKEYGPPFEPFRKKGLYLAAVGLSLSHPVTGLQMKVTAGPPAKFRLALPE